MKAAPCIAISLIRNLAKSRSARASRRYVRQLDYLKPRRVLCDLLSHSLRARDGRLHRRDETKVTLNLFNKDVEWFKRPSSSAITAARAPPAAEPDAASIT